MSSSEGQKCSSLVGLSQWSCISLIGNQRRWLRKLWSCCYYTWQATKGTLINIGYQSQYHTISNQSCKWSSTTRTHEEHWTQGPKCSSSIDPSEWSCKSLNGNQRWHEKPWSCCYLYMRSHEGHSNQQGITILMSSYFQSKVANNLVLQGITRSLQIKSEVFSTDRPKWMILEILEWRPKIKVAWETLKLLLLLHIKPQRPLYSTWHIHLNATLFPIYSRKWSRTSRTHEEPST